MSEIRWTLWNFDGLRLLPARAFDLDIVKERYPAGTQLRAKFAKPRSKNQLDLYWKLLRKVVEATDMWMTEDDLHEAIKLHLRMVRGIRLLGGSHGQVGHNSGYNIQYITRSIALDQMDQGEFNLYFKKAQVAIEEATGIDVDALIKEITRECRYEAA